MWEEEAKKYLESLTTQSDSISKWDLDDREEIMVKDNNSIIDWANVILKERLFCKDRSLRVQDIISAKNDAFRQNQIILGKGEDAFDTRKLIPAVINIQIINN